MTTDGERGDMQNRGLLTSDDRAFFSGDKEFESEEKKTQARRDKRHNIRQRMEHIAEDIELLQEAGEDDLVNEFYADIGRYERLEQQIRELQEQVEK